MSDSLKEAISDNQRVESGNRQISLNSHCSFSSSSKVSSNATSINNGVFLGERLRFRDKLIRGDEGKTELMGTKYSLKQSENTIIKSSSVTNNIRCKYAILTFTRLNPLAKSIHVQMDRVVALS